MAEIKKRYSDEDLAEFKQIIDEKLERARKDYSDMMKQLRNDEGNDVADTSPTYKVLEEGSTTQNRAEILVLAERQQKFIKGLEQAIHDVGHCIRNVIGIHVFADFAGRFETGCLQLLIQWLGIFRRLDDFAEVFLLHIQSALDQVAQIVDQIRVVTFDHGFNRYGAI